MGALRKLMQDSRQLIRVFSTIRPKIVIRLLKGTGLILLPMIVAINTFFKPASRNFPWSWYAMLTSKIENLMVQFTGNRWVRSCDMRFWKGGDTFSDADWINHIWKSSNKTLFQYCKYSCDAQTHICAIQGHTGGYVIVLELMGQVAWKTVRRNYIGTWMGKKYRPGNVFLFIGSKDCSCQQTWMISKWLERSRIWLACGGNGW